MNCLECRHRLLTTPQTRDAELVAHLQKCAACARLAGEQRRFEQQLGAALRVPVPENLHDRVRFAASMRRRRPMRWLAAVAAAGILAVGLGMGGWEYRTSTQLTQQLAQRMQSASEPTHALTTPRLARLGERLDAFLKSADMGAIVSARERPMHGRQAAQFDIVHGDEAASVFMVPDTWLAMTHEVQANGMPGKLIPFQGGVIGVFCPDRAMLRRVAANIKAALSLDS